MATYSISMKVKWWVKPYLVGVSFIGSIWCMIVRPDADVVDAWIAKRGDFVAKHGVVPSLEPIP